MSSMERIHEALAKQLGPDRVSRDVSILSSHSGDWSDTAQIAPRMIVFPRTPEEVGVALKLLGDFSQKVVIQGGLTGLAGGGTPRQDEVAISLAKLKTIEAFDDIGGTVIVQAGVTLEELQTYVEAQGWMFPLDLGARGSCQIGGNSATNAGGNRVVRYGTMRDRVLGLEVALPDGRMLAMMNEVTKNTTGIDLKQLFIGSEGTLGVITRLVLKLEPKPTSACTALCALRTFGDAARLLKVLRAHLPSLSSFELMWDNFMASACEVAALKPPFSDSWPLYVIVETLGASEEEQQASLQRALEAALESGMVQDVIVAQSLEQTRQVWAYREAIGELLSRMKPHAAFDIGIPMHRMEAFVGGVRQALAESFPQQNHLFFGHLGDGNLHILSGPFDDGEALHRVEKLVYERVAEAGGCISAEHGIGVVKKPYLHLSRSGIELEMMRALKATFDPRGILNEGRVLSSNDTGDC